MNGAVAYRRDSNGRCQDERANCSNETALTRFQDLANLRRYTLGCVTANEPTISNRDSECVIDMHTPLVVSQEYVGAPSFVQDRTRQPSNNLHEISMGKLI